MATRISVSEGSGLASSSARQVIIIPGVQKPHWSPCLSLKPCWIGSSSVPLASPSTVRTWWPSAMTASTVQDLTGWPSSWTTHVPQFEVSQPQRVPVSLRSPRRKCTSSNRGSTSRVCATPLTVTVICMSGLLPAGPGGGPAQRPGGQLAGQVALVVLRPALVGDRAHVLGGDPAGLDERLLGGRPAAQRVLGLDGAEVLRADSGQPDADLGD